MITTPTSTEANSYATVSEADDYLVTYNNFSVWDNLTTEMKEAYLKRATREVEMFAFRTLPFYFQPFDYREEQALSFPLLEARTKIVSTSSSITSDTLPVKPFSLQSSLTSKTFKGGGVIILTGANKGEVYLITSTDVTNSTITIDTTVSLDKGVQIRLVEAVPKEVVWATIEQAYLLSTSEPNPYLDKGITSEKIGSVTVQYTKPETSKFKGVEISLGAVTYLEPFIRRSWELTE